VTLDGVMMIIFCRCCCCRNSHVESCQLHGSSISGQAALLLSKGVMLGAGLRGEFELIEVEPLHSRRVMEAAGWRL
jgi:hypothetical protein